MKLTFETDLGQGYTVDIDPGMELENVMALLEAEYGIPIHEQGIHFRGKELSDPKKTMREYGLSDDAVLSLRRKVVGVGGRTVEQDSEMMRLQLLGNPGLMDQISVEQPELAEAARSNPARFAELLRLTGERLREIELQRQREIMQLNNDPFNVEAQRKIEEHIRQQAVLENMEHALEFSPESFGRVTMLYIPVEVNSHPVKAFVDSGAQQTIMSPECAEACGIMRLIDQRFAGIARGVGTARILGRVHSAHLKLAGLFLPCSFTIMEGRDVDLLFGLDMLKAHQACIDLEKGVLRIQGREVKFLSEHELPHKARFPGEVMLSPEPSGSSNQAQSPSPGRNFPGSGKTLGSAPVHRSSNQSSSPNQYPERSIKTLVDLGASKEEAIKALELTGGNVDSAAALLF